MLRISFDKDGQYMGVNHRWHQPTSVGHWWADLYVDPHDNIIKETAALRKKLGIKKFKYQWPNNEKPMSDVLRRTNKKAGLIKLNNCWFSFVLNSDPKLFDKDLYEDIKTSAWRKHLKWSVVSQKQLSKKQLKQHGLKNGGRNG